MKIPMNLTIDLGDDFVECDECGSEYSMSEALKVSITSSIKNAVISHLSGGVVESIREDIKMQITNQLKPYILGIMESEMKNLKIREYHGDKEVDASAYICAKLVREIQDSNVTNMVRQIAENYVKSIKERYDVVFASTLIDKMLKASLLKDDRVATLLMEPEQKQ